MAHFNYRIGDIVEALASSDLVPGTRGIVRRIGSNTIPIYYLGIEIIDNKGFEFGHDLDGLLQNRNGWNIHHTKVKFVQKGFVQMSLKTTKELR